MKQEQKNSDIQNIVPLSGDEIQSILKSQSETVFEEKNISNNSNFVKKSLIDIALDFKSKQNVQEEEGTNNTPEKIYNLEEENDITINERKREEVIADENFENSIENDVQGNGEEQLDKKEADITNEANLNKDKVDSQSEKNILNETLEGIEIDNQKQENDFPDEKKSDEFIKADNETQQALDSVRDAVSQSMDKIEDETKENFKENNEITDNESETIIKDYENFKNILSSLSNLSQTAIYEVFQNKIFELAYELAGSQIDKMPEKYEKKIKNFLKNINCYEDKITIEINDKDFEALSKIKNFNKNDEKTVFISNKELSRGDIILNCDGMRYSEKSVFRAYTS